jgi:general secretion pathway protein A
MYTDFYQLQTGPFEPHPRSRFLFLGDTHREALALLIYAIDQRKPLVVLTGAPGAGKTTLLSILGRVVRKRGERWQTALLVNPAVDLIDFYKLLFHELGADHRGRTKADFLNGFDRFLRERFKKYGRIVLLIDEAQDLDDEMLREIRFLLNVSGKYPNTLQVMLSGQPMLESRISADALRNLHQRVSMWCRLRPLNDAEIREYIARRLEAAGSSPDRQLFDDAALAQLCVASGGLPATINSLCDNSLMLGALKRLSTIDAATVREAVAEAGLSGSLGTEPPESGPSPLAEPWLRRVFGRGRSG